MLINGWLSQWEFAHFCLKRVKIYIQLCWAVLKQAVNTLLQDRYFKRNSGMQAIQTKHEEEESGKHSAPCVMPQTG